MDEHVHHEETRRLAYQLWLERGAPTGSPETDWREAEHRLQKDRLAEATVGQVAALSAATDLDEG